MSDLSAHGLSGLLGTVVGGMIYNLPALESVVILPLIVKRYRWVALGCVAVAAFTFGVELRAGSHGGLLSSGSDLTLLAIQIALSLAIASAVFALKVCLLRSLRRGDTSGKVPP